MSINKEKTYIVESVFWKTKKCYTRKW